MKTCLRKDYLLEGRLFFNLNFKMYLLKKLFMKIKISMKGLENNYSPILGYKTSMKQNFIPNLLP